jgi:hypothetical protein
MSYTPFTPNLVDLLRIQGINSDPYVYDTNKFSLLEQIGILFERMNQNLTMLNTTQSEVLQFENYVLTELQNYDLKVQQEVVAALNNLISDGTISNLINQTIFNALNTSITNITNTVNQNKTLSDNKFSELDEEIASINYKFPSVTLSSSPSQTLYNVGETINSLVLNFNIVKGTNNLTKAEVYKNGVLLTTITSINAGTNTYTDGNIINADTNYYIKVYDDKESYSSNTIQYNFVYNIYYGKAGETDTINSSFILSLNSLKTLKDNLAENFILNDEQIIYSYPSSYGDLIAIKNFGAKLIEIGTKVEMVWTENF